MGQLQKAIESELEKLPRVAALKLSSAKLEALGIHDDEIASQLADAILASDDHPIQIDWPDELTIEFDDGDLNQLQAEINRLVEQITSVIERFTADIAEEIVSSFRQQWRGSQPFEEPAAQVRSRVIKDWADAIDALQMLLSLCAQEGDDFNKRHLKSRRGTPRNEALARLHIRGCRIAEEILLLIEHGFTEGAQARWRTLHEIAITATLIKEGDSPLAERFYDHESIERYNLLKDVRRAAIAGGAAKIPILEAKEIERDFARVVAKYNKSFQGMYGWASEQLGMPKEPKFHDLQDAAGSLSLKHRFRIASSGNHVSVATLSQPIHQWDPTTTVPGTFEPGLEGPGVDTAHAIVQLTTALYDEPWDLDKLVIARVILQLRDDTSELWLRTAQLIDEREQRVIDRAARFGADKRFGYVKAKPVKRS